MIAEGPSRGACSVTTPSNGAPDIPDHSESPNATRSGGNSRGALLTCIDNNPPASRDSTGTRPTASTVSRTTPPPRRFTSMNSG